MLSRLSIRNIVLAKELDLEFFPGLCVLTGETGAGKSVLLDSLNLALGKRAESRLVRANEEEAEVIAEFDIPSNHMIYQKLAADELIEAGESFILRRKINKDGRSKAWLNGRPVPAGVLKSIGNDLLEFHGQFDTQKLLDSHYHKYYLDKYAGHDKQLHNVLQAWQAWQDAKKALKIAKENIQKQAGDEDFLRFAVDELDKLDVQPDEEGQLSEKRHVMKQALSFQADLQQVEQHIEGESGVFNQIRNIQNTLEKADDKAEGQLNTLVSMLDVVTVQIDDVLREVQVQQQKFNFSSYDFEQLEDRLYAVREAARKYGVPPSELPEKWAELKQNLDWIDHSEDKINQLNDEVKKAKEKYIDDSQKLFLARKKAAEKLVKNLNKELVPLHMSQSSFHIAVEKLDEGQWNSTGMEFIEFRVATHRGAAPALIGKIASGGELARFMLALRIVFAKVDGITTLVLDEADAGISGRIADAMGERLNQLADGLQLLVITHSPQVAAQGQHHWQVVKNEDHQILRSEVVYLEEKERIEVIAAMLSGKEITKEARAAAKKLLQSRKR